MIQAEERHTTSCPELDPQPRRYGVGSVRGEMGDQGGPHLTAPCGRPLRCRQHRSPLR